MKRLTMENIDFNADFVASHLQSWPIAQSLRRLQEIEDILGDDYDLEYLKRLVQGEAGNPFEVPCTAGTICVEKGAACSLYPSVFVYLRNRKGDDVNLVAVEGDGIIPEDMDPDQFEGQTGCDGGVKAYLYGDTTSDEWTDCFHFEKEDLEYDEEV